MFIMAFTCLLSWPLHHHQSIASSYNSSEHVGRETGPKQHEASYSKAHSWQVTKRRFFFSKSLGRCNTIQPLSSYLRWQLTQASRHRPDKRAVNICCIKTILLWTWWLDIWSLKHIFTLKVWQAHMTNNTTIMQDRRLSSFFVYVVPSCLGHQASLTTKLPNFLEL